MFHHIQIYIIIIIVVVVVVVIIIIIVVVIIIVLFFLSLDSCWSIFSTLRAGCIAQP